MILLVQLAASRIISSATHSVKKAGRCWHGVRY